MSELDLAALLAILEDDRDLLDMLCEAGLLAPPLERGYSPEEAERLRVVRVLVRDLDVNLAGVEVILHLRRQVWSLQRRMLELLDHLPDGDRD